ncbi:GNAT family protein [Evansella sp. AB-P1]|uniref:GNAT family N-acetyltransferase n=1 Tax=Evansella sp. AB-P1 TaxID=3037653 RepID=UPI00241F612B|nr:GNAT family protein [Evansella sp. AB-P1]MDG5789241.1 GNAT family protein [Evansella sp. AB-P1]
MEIADIYGDLPTLETDRLVLRKVTMEDVSTIFKYGSDEEVSRYVTWDIHRTIADSEEFVKFVLNQYENKKIAPWAMELKENGKLIGTVDFVSWQTKHHTAEIGYVIAKEFWGNGYTTEAAKAIITFGFEKMDLVRIQARCFTENVASQRVMEKVGMTYEGLHRKAMLIKGKHRDLKMFAVLKEDQ